jgi:hypothetical protein
LEKQVITGIPSLFGTKKVLSIDDQQEALTDIHAIFYHGKYQIL